MHNERLGFVIALALYSLSMLTYIFFFILRKEKLYNIGIWSLRIGLVFHTLAIISRTVQTSHIPLTSQYEFASSFAWGTALSFIGFDWRYKFKALGMFITPIILAVTFYAAMQSMEIKPLMPVLRSKWLVFHVSTAVISYGSFAVACAVSIMYLSAEKLKDGSFLKTHMPEPQALDHASYKAISLGFIMLTFVIITGAIWAERAWGRYWQWDPKETWSLITWLIYAIYLHTRLNRGWKDRKAAWYAIIGFISILFTYIGVNTILSGYHSYGLLLNRFLFC